MKEILTTQGESGIEIKSIYTPNDIEGMDYLRDLGFPGEFPFTRGVYPMMYIKKPWVMRLYSGFGTCEETNKRWKFLLDAGEDSVSCAFDLPTQLGFDTDDPLVEDEVGLSGVSIDTLEDMETLFNGISLDKIPASFNICDPGIVILAMFILAAKKQGVTPDKLMGTLRNDILLEYVCRGNWIFPPEYSLRLNSDIFEYCLKYMPKFYPINIAGILVREAGGSMIQEIGYSFSAALCYINKALERKLTIDDITSRISFFFSSSPYIFEEVAKYRAAKRLWARILKEKLGVKQESSMRMRFTSCASGSWFRKQDPELNLVRGAYANLASILGGAQAMLGTAMDEAFAIPTERTAALAIKSQLVLAEETGIRNTVDPLGGSYFIERLTNEMEGKIEALMQDIEDKGRIIYCIERGYIQKQIAERAYQVLREEEKGQRVIVGVNKYVGDQGEVTLKLHEPNYETIRKQIDKLKRIKNQRNYERVKQELERLQDAARGKENLVPYVIRAAESNATIGEIVGVLKNVFGKFTEPVAF
jgi:methylmalonyl-CoA mutase N-terminal domain/subunit